MNYRSILIVCLATLGLAGDSWGQGWDKIAFVSDREGSPNIWVMNADGSDPVNLTKGRYCTGPAWSPDGMKIAYIDFGDDEIWLMDADGSNQQPVTDDSVQKVWLAWSEDGSRIYYDTLPTGHPRDGTESFVIGIEDGSSPLPVDREKGAIARTIRPPSPDGTKSMFIRRDGDQTDIYIVYNSGDERTPTRLTDSPNFDINPTWAPDGMRIAFASGSSLGDLEIWAVDIDGSNLVELTNDLGGNFPAWRPASPSATSVEAQSWGWIKSIIILEKKGRR